jgi:Family of unknown function (DUF5343)
MTEDSKQVAPVYVGWQTFKNTLDQLSQGLPHVIDKKVFEGQSWGMQAQLMSALKFLGLIDDAGVPSPALVALAVPEEEERKKQFEVILRERYAPLFALDLTKVTPTQLSQEMSASYGVSADTREKAIRFFLGAAYYLGIPLSRFVKVPKSGSGGNGTPRRRKAKKAKPLPEPAPAPPSEATGGGSSKTIAFGSGGTLKVVASLDYIALSPTERKFFNEVIEKFEEYEQSQSGQRQTPAGGEE